MLVEPEQDNRLVGRFQPVDHPVHLAQHSRFPVILGYKFGMVADRDRIAPPLVAPEIGHAAVETHAVDPCRQPRLPPEPLEAPPEIYHRLLAQVIEVVQVGGIEIAHLPDNPVVLTQQVIEGFPESGLPAGGVCGVLVSHLQS